MDATAKDAEIIILSDDEDEASENDTSCTESSLYIVEPDNMRKPDIVLTPCTLEEDLVVTFSRPAEVLPHARYDCPIHPFTSSYRAIEAPLAVNQLFCDQCFCYICDKLASSCNLWCVRGSCHCNSHKKSKFWSEVWSCRLLGGLHSFHLTLSEVDAHLRHADTMLQIFKKDMFEEFSMFLLGKVLAECGPNAPNQQQVVHDYTPVYNLVSSFLDEADKRDDRAAAILRLGAAHEFMRHIGVPRCILQSPVADAYEAKKLLLQRVISALQRQLVRADFKPEFRKKLQDFYERFYFPPELKNLRTSLCVRPWDDILLVTVLKGQNVSGVRKEGKKKDVLKEDFSVVLLRCEQLQQQKRYREVCRYLRVVQSAESACSLQQLRDLIPFFICLEGDLASAVDSLLRPGNGPASRFTPQLFLNYLRIFQSATAPKVTLGHPSHLWHSDEAWEPIEGAVPLKRETLVKFALKVQGCCPAVYASSQCWTSFLAVVNKASGSGAGLPAPHPSFLQEAASVVGSLLLDQNIHIPRFFLEAYPDQALLLLATGALGLRILRSPLEPALPVLSTFKDNLWALGWLPTNLPFEETKNLGPFLRNVREEIRGTKGDGHFLQFLSSHLERVTRDEAAGAVVRPGLDGPLAD